MRAEDACAEGVRRPAVRPPGALLRRSPPAAATVTLIVVVLGLLVLSGVLSSAGTSLSSGRVHVPLVIISPAAPRVPALTGSAPQPAVKTGNSWAASVPPAAREGAASTFDGAIRGDLMFGGWNGSSYLSDTWEFANNQWLELSPATSPPARMGAALTYDNHDGYVVLFGGADGSGPMSDTWKFANGTWTNLNLAVHPSARHSAGMTYDGTVGDAYVVLFGGVGTTSTLSDTWKFVKGAWSQLTISGGAPSGRSSAGLTYDTRDGFVLLFGGRNISGGTTTYLGGTWSFTAGVWTQKTPSTSPSARADFAFVNDVSDGYVVLFGGTVGPTSNPLGDTWTFAASKWTEHAIASHPSARSGSIALWDDVDHYVLLANGATDGLPIGATDSWEYLAGNWSLLLSLPLLFEPEPSARTFASTANDTADNAVLLFGGVTGVGVNNETWEFSTQRWTEVFPSSSPSTRADAMMTYDAQDGYVLLFGGLSGTGATLGDTWEYKAGVWTQLHVTTTPSPRYAGAMTYDALDHEVVLFGGTSGTSYLSDTWVFKGGAWSNLAPSPAPSMRAFSSITYDGYDKYVLLFGGLSSVVLGDTWTFVGGSWKLLTGNVTPPASWAGGIDFLPHSNEVILFGGCTAATANPTAGTCASVLGQTMKFYKSKWRTFAPPGPPPARFAMAHSYDAVDKELLLFSGSTGSGRVLDRWIFVGTNWTRWFPVILPDPRGGAPGTYDHRDQHILVFGGVGTDSSGKPYYLDDTWNWDTGVWAEAVPLRAPPARAYAAMAFDASDNVVVMFGGFGPSGYLNDTWTWVGGQYTGDWTQVHGSVAPSPRANASITYDTSLNKILLFGGQDASGVFGDTWTYHAGVWAQLTPRSSPPARASAGLAFDTLNNYDVLFGGFNGSSGKAYGDTWTYAGGTWSQLTTTTAPSARYGFGMLYAFQQARAYNFVLLFGGETASHSYLGDTWQFTNGTWTQVLVGAKGQPIPAAYMTMSQDTIDGNPILFGGISSGGVLGDFWVYR